jgi:hypothetical protein
MVPIIDRTILPACCAKTTIDDRRLVTRIMDDASVYSSKSTVRNELLTSQYSESNDSSESKQPLAYKETLAVNRSKILVIFVLMAAAALVATSAYLITSNQEESNFEGDVSCQ